MGAVLTGFLIIGIALPVLPLYVHQRLGFGTFVVGLVAGSQFAAAVITRIWAGSFADNRGGKRAVIAGLLAAAASGLLYLLSFAFIAMPPVSVGFLLLGRALLGGGESFIITGGVSWALSLVDTGHAGKVIAWIGTAMFAATRVGRSDGSGPLRGTRFRVHCHCNRASSSSPFSRSSCACRRASPSKQKRGAHLAALQEPSGCRGWEPLLAASATAPSLPSARCCSLNAAGIPSGSRSPRSVSR